MTTTKCDIITLTPDAVGMGASLWGLIYRAGYGDRKALDRILGLLLFTWNGEPTTVLGLLDGLMTTVRAWECAGKDSLVLDAAGAQCTDKLSHIPVTGAGRERRPDARFYYRAMANHIAASLVGRPLPDAIELECRVRRAFRRFTITHFYRSVCDCYRRFAGLRSRYVWKSLVLWLPKEIGGRQRHAFLKALVGEVHPDAPGEQERVQQIIDGHCANRRVLSIDDLEPWNQPQTRIEMPWSLEYGISTFGLARTVAEEKATCIKDQRPGIAVLGPERLKAMVLRIFDDLASGTYSPTAISDAYHLDRATFSRFAGIRWRNGRLTGIPDLFRNLAWVVSKDPRWAQCAQEAGLWPRIEDVLKQLRKGQHHE